jgi:hypothetical protein
MLLQLTEKLNGFVTSYEQALRNDLGKKEAVSLGVVNVKEGCTETYIISM